MSLSCLITERLAAVSLATARDSRVVLKEVHKNKLDFFFFFFEERLNYFIFLKYFLSNNISFK